MPCALLVNRRCSDYASRPRQCRDFRCKLLVRLAEGSIELDDARAVVARIQALAGPVLSAGKLPTPKASIERLLDLGELKALLARHIQDP
jgi:hypothetical protein